MGDFQTVGAGGGDFHGFVDGFEKAVAFGTHVGGVGLVGSFQDGCEFDDFLRLGVFARQIPKAGGEAGGALLKCFVQNLFHLVHFVAGRFAVLIAHDHGTDGVMACESDDVDGRLAEVQFVGIRFDIAPAGMLGKCRGGTAVADDFRRDALGDFGVRVWVVHDFRIGMGMRVNEAWCECKTIGVNGIDT